MKKNLYPRGFQIHWNRLKCLACLWLFAISTPAFAQIQLVEDLNTTVHNAFGEFGSTKEVNGVVYVAANKGLWRTNGTQEGSVLLKQFKTISSFVEFRNQLFFVAETTVHGLELWKSNGTVEGTVLVKDIEPGRGGSAAHSLVVANNYLFFITTTTAYGTEVWRSNGSTGGTFLLRDIIRGKSSSNPSSLVAYQNRLFFAASDGLVGQELWSSDGSTAGTNLFKDLRIGKPGSGPGDLRVSGSLLFFQALDDTNGRELWRSNGTASGTWMVENIRPGTASSTPRNLVDVGGILYFAAKEDHNIVEFWRSDGTPAGTFRAFSMEDGSPLVGMWVPLRDVAATDEALYFYRADELYRFDGTTAHPILIAQLGDFYEDNVTLHVLDNVLYTIEEVPSYSDYEPERVDIRRYANGSLSLVQRFPGYFTTHLNKTSIGLLFEGPTDDGKFMLWKSDGTYGGSVPFFDVTDFTLGSGPSSLVQVDGNVLFAATDNSGERKLFKMDGTTTAIELVKDVLPENLTQSGNRGYFTYLGDLWRTNGTATGTALVKSFNGSPGNFTDVNGTLFFSAPDQYNTSELWKSTGSFTSTVRVKDIYPGSPGSNPSDFVNLNGTLFFLADHPTYGRSLWKSNGTDAGTVVVQPANPDHAFVNPRNLVAAQSQVFFIANGPTTGTELYRTDGTSAGTMRVKDIRQNDFTMNGSSQDISHLHADGNKVYFHAIAANDSRRLLWVSDGSEGGTFQVAELLDVMYLQSLNGRMFFAVPDEARQRMQLFSTNGTPEGTTFIKIVDISYVLTTAIMNNVLYFGGPGYFGGTSDLWRTDGTACGTFVVPSDLGYGVRIFQDGVKLLLNKDRRLVFTGLSSNVGSELFKLEKSLAPTSPCGTPTVATAELVAEVMPGAMDKNITSAPNPFTDRFTLRVDAPDDKPYDASILNVNGVEMSLLHDLRTNQDYEVGAELRPGMYLIKIKLDNKFEVRRMIKTQ